jgi:cyclohexanecarboxylate-CoA ligase
VAAFDTDLTAARVRDWTARRLWRDETVERYLDRWATTRSARTAMVDGSGRCTWAELARTVERVAHGLAAHGLTPGRVIACQLPNWSEFVVVLLAAARLGAVVNPIPPIYRASELRFMLNRVEAVAVVIPGVFRGFDHVAMLAALRPAVPSLEHVFVARGTPGPGMQPFGVLTETPWEARAGRRGLPGTDPNAVHEVIFTSGTTGEPKGVMHTPNTVLANVYPVLERLDLSERDVVLMSSTFAHQTGYLYGYCALLVLGATGVWLDVWSAEAAAQLVEREHVTFTMGATPFLRDLTYVSGHDFSSLRIFISAGAPIPRPLVADARARLGCAISPGWGMTENGLVTCVGPRDPEDKVLTTDGSPARGMELAIVDAEGRPLPPDVEGDLLVRGASQFVGYYKRPDFTRDAHTGDGWFRTGDRGRIDGDGYLSITGRTKDLIIRGGENIPVAEVESVLFTHPKVAGVAVVGMPDPRLGERACAFVVPRSGEAPPTLAELVAWLDAHQLARQKFPERLELVDEFPMTPSGKVQKYRLRQTVAERLAREAGEAR